MVSRGVLGGKVFAVVALLALLAAAPAEAQPPVLGTAAPVQAGDHKALFDDYGWVGCFTGATMLGTAGYTAFSSGGMMLVAWVVNGCQLGSLVLGPVGMMIRDFVTGDDAFDRYMKDAWKEVEASMQPKNRFPVQTADR